MKRVIAILSVMALMVVFTVTPALAQQQRGLVNVNVEDVTIQVPVGIAANVCDVNANVLAQQIAQTGSAECDAAVEQNL